MMRQTGEGQSATANSVSLPAPVGGWNTRDPWASMKSTDAIVLDNMFPQSNDLMLRKGSVGFATVPSDETISTLMTYAAPDGGDSFFAATENGIYDVTAGGDVAAADLVITNGVVQHTMITTAGGSFLWCCNGTDDPAYYDGGSWVTLNSGSTPVLDGLTAASIVNVTLFKSRLFFIQKNSLSLWYLDVNSIAGTAAEFPLGAIFRKGGYLVAAESWTLDAGDGPDDRLVIITSEGEVAVYVGIDPSNAATWALSGVYQLSPPIGRKCFIRLGSDVAVLTASGLLPLSTALVSLQYTRSVALTDKVQKALNDYYLSSKNLPGWQTALYPDVNMLIVNVPYTGTVSYQFVMNTMTKAWARFTGLNALSWAVFGGNLYFCTGYAVKRAWVGQTDSGDAITARVRQAYTAFGLPGKIKRINLIRLIMTMSDSTPVKLAVDSDYEIAVSGSGTTSTIGAVGDVWDTAVWDTAKWAGFVSILQWRKIFHKHGHTLSLRVELSSSGASLTWTATNFILETGGMI